MWKTDEIKSARYFLQKAYELKLKIVTSRMNVINGQTFTTTTPSDLSCGSCKGITLKEWKLQLAWKLVNSIH